MAMGSIPRIVVRAVSRTGRRRVEHPKRMASFFSTPLPNELVDVVDHDDAVVDGDPLQEDEADQDGQVDRHSPMKSPMTTPMKPEGDREHDDERVEEGLELRGHDHVDEERGQGEGGEEDLEGVDHLLVSAAVLEEIALRELLFETGQSLLDVPDDASQVPADDIGRDGHAPGLVLAA